MQEHEVRLVVEAVLAEQSRLHNENVDNETLRTISTILTSFGIEEVDRIEMRADFQHFDVGARSVSRLSPSPSRRW